MSKPRGYWDIKDNVFKEAKKYQTISEFWKGCGSAYDAARKHNWLGEMIWFKEIYKPRGYWTKEKVFAEAKKYKTKNTFRKGCMTAYLYAYRNKWLKEMDWFKDERLDIINDKIDSVYKYYFKETNSIYIGRTLIKQQKLRDCKHNTSEKDTVFRYAKENGLDVPPMVIIEENITVKEGLKIEDYWVNYYKKKGYNVLNKAKTGIGSGSIGAIAKGKWSKNKVFAASKTCETKTEFKKKYRGAYVKALNNGWLSEMNWFVNGHVKWAKEKATNGKCSKPVLQIDKNTNEVIAEFPSIHQAERQLGFNNSSISKCCKNKPNYNTAYGYKWMYKPTT